MFGGRKKDEHHIIGSLLDAAYKAVNDFIDAVNTAPELDINLPKRKEQWVAINVGLKMKSTNEIISRCTGALDGFSQQTNKPSQKEYSTC